MTEKRISLTDRVVACLHDLSVMTAFGWFGLKPDQALPLIVYLLTTGSALALFRNRLVERPFVHPYPWSAGALMCVELGGLVLILNTGLMHPIRGALAAAAWVAVRALLIPRAAEAELPRSV